MTQDNKNEHCDSLIKTLSCKDEKEKTYLILNEDFAELTSHLDLLAASQSQKLKTRKPRCLQYLCNRFGKRFQESLYGHGILLYD